MGPGLWSGFVDTTVVKDKRVTCGASSSETASLRVQVERSRATRLVLQSYPTRLSADIPLAEVQAYLINGVGERLPPGEIRIGAQLGDIHLDKPGEEPIVRARYDGSKASASGGMMLSRHRGGVLRDRGWCLGCGHSRCRPVRIGPCPARRSGSRPGGRPIDGMPGTFRLGESTKEIVTANGGWATSTFAWPDQVDYVIGRIEIAGRVEQHSWSG